MEAFVVAICSMTVHGVLAVPPQACFANFRWDDCGQDPQPVMYYWKPGSRCEVGIWRGCLPNYNMFKDEHECVSTCIFSVRASAPDFHDVNGPFDDEEESTVQEAPVTESDESGENNSTIAGNATDAAGANNQTAANNNTDTAPANNDNQAGPANNDTDTVPANNDTETAPTDPPQE